MPDVILPKLSLMIHYGLYALLGGEYQGATVPWLGEWIQHTANIPKKVYSRLAKEFTAARFAPEQLCRFAKEQGFESLVFTAKHHDGFALFNTQVDGYKSSRDLVQELSDAAQKAGLKFSLYYSQAQDWSDENAYTAYSQKDPKEFASYFENKCLPQVKELLTHYGPIFSLWFDTPDRMPESYARKLRTTVKALQPTCLISARIGYGLGDYAVCQDNALPSLPWTLPWEVPISLYDSWGYKKQRVNEKSSAELLELFLKTLARGGHCLLNLGPKGDGSMMPQDLKALAAVGAYARDKAPAIYGTTAAPVPLFEDSACYLSHKAADCRLFLHFPKGNKNKRIYNLVGYDGSLLQANLVQNGRIDEMLPANDRKTLEGDPCWSFELPESPKPLCIALKYHSNQKELCTVPLLIQQEERKVL